MTLRLFRLLLLLTLVPAGHLLAQLSRPNIIFILTDDLGYGDVGAFSNSPVAYGGDRRFDTPHLDRMAASGMLLTDHYVSGPVCAPSRASFLLGLHQGHSPVRNNQFDKELPAGLNVASLLAGAGYRTVHVGKYGLASKRGSALAGHPLRRGFTDFYGFLHHIDGHEHYPRNGTTEKQSLVVDGYEPVLRGTEKTYTTDLFTARAKAYLIEQQRARPEQPLFMYLAYDTPHSKLQLPPGPYPEGYGLDGGLVYTGPDDPETPHVNTARGTIDSYVHPDYRDRDWPPAEKVFASMVRRIDTAVGDLLQLLVDLEIDDNTIVVFSSDNGPHNVNGQDPTWFRSYGPFTGIKRDMYEGGIRVPTIARWPGRIAAGTASAEPVGNWDWLATFAELARVPVPAFSDGVSLAPLLTGDSSTLSREYLYWEYFHPGKTPPYADFPAPTRDRRRGEMQAVRIGRYKGVRFDIQRGDAPFEIYDLVNDRSESTNLASRMPDLERRMREISRRARMADTSAVRPYDTLLVPAVSEPNELRPGVVRRNFEINGTWIPERPDYGPEVMVEHDGPALTGATGLPTGRGYEWTAFLRIPRDGAYTFELTADGAAYVRLHDIHLLRNEPPLRPTPNSARVWLAAGLHPITVRYIPATGTKPVFALRWTVPDGAPALIPSGAFHYSPALVAHPRFR
ncbi:sulfatase-like hydrolase/transferase [Lewinella sp. JB7]|uniref:sulfatase-like hydrolase/transferase n=1 Tax=Lewinella sp. JB7 TaxID=2962887 RepID=UPI0020C94DB3|nr:sulfatase-like hydrolase/transferase [Lewinella sp. JB7]MCP9236683.1 sulfatase-like hydrolase/transferase [Lewinella sp. JB7]